MDVHRMRLLFVHPAVLSAPNHEGSIKAYRALVGAFADAGHDCEVVTVPSPSGALPIAGEWSLLSSIASPGLGVMPRFSLTRPLPLSATRSGHDGRFVSALRSARAHLALGDLLRRRIAAFDPDWVISENGTMSAKLLRVLAGRRWVTSVATPASLPFGPRRTRDTWRKPPGDLAHVAKSFCPSRYVRDYLEAHLGVESTVQPNIAYGRGPYRELAEFDGAVTMLNPAAHKGGHLFAELARRFPRRTFRAITSYADVVPELASIPNVLPVEANDDLDSVLSNTSVLLVPSMWGEAWGMIVVDAMLRGIPVIASDDGGLPESMLGVAPSISLSPGRLRRRWNGSLEFTTKAIDLAPWCSSLEELLDDRQRWQARSTRSRDHATRHVAGLTLAPLLHLLSNP